MVARRCCSIVVAVAIFCQLLLAKDAANSILPVHPKAKQKEAEPGGFQWKPALVQSAVFLAIQHSFRMATEPDTRGDLRGPFFRDYFRSVRNVGGWSDGDPAYVNYVGHPIQGAVTGYIAVQNDPRFRRAEFGMSKEYWQSRLRAMAFSAVYSLQFEIGPISEASLGNVQKDRERGLVDWVVTPTLGTAWMVVEDAVDRYLIERIEGSTDVRVIKILARGWLNPTRSFSNMLRLKVPWHRDTRDGVSERLTFAE